EGRFHRVANLAVQVRANFCRYCTLQPFGHVSLLDPMAPELAKRRLGTTGKALSDHSADDLAGSGVAVASLKHRRRTGEFVHALEIRDLAAQRDGAALLPQRRQQ